MRGVGGHSTHHSRVGRIGGLTTEDARKRMMAEVLTRLYGVATDEETAVLDSLTLRAGIAWHCTCGWHNSERVRYCEDCGLLRHQLRHDPSTTAKGKGEHHGEGSEADRHREARRSLGR